MFYSSFVMHVKLVLDGLDMFDDINFLLFDSVMGPINSGILFD
jgi:hypothetical protein